MIDRYIMGHIIKTSQESGCPVFKQEGKILCPGAAANIAANLARLGARVTLVTMLSERATNRPDLIVEMCSRFGIEVVPLYCLSRTTTKTRYLNPQNQVIWRNDDEEIDDHPEDRVSIVKYLEEQKIKDHEAIVLSDYAKGFFSSDKYDPLNDYLRDALAFTTIFADPKPANIRAYPAHFVTPNEQECLASLGSQGPYVPKLGSTLATLLKTTTIVTRGPVGYEAFDPKGIMIDAGPSLVDTALCDIGAGGAFLAGFVLTTMKGWKIEDAIHFASAAAACAVEQPFTSTSDIQTVTRRFYARRKPSRASLAVSV